MASSNKATSNGIIDPAFGERIRHAREERGFTVRELASMIGCSAAQLTRLELANRRVGNAKWLKNLAEVLCIPYDELAKLAGSEYETGEVSLLKRALPSIVTPSQERAIGEFASVITRFRLSEVQLMQLVELTRGMAQYYEQQNSIPIDSRPNA